MKIVARLFAFASVPFVFLASQEGLWICFSLLTAAILVEGVGALIDWRKRVARPSPPSCPPQKTHPADLRAPKDLKPTTDDPEKEN